MDRITGFSGLCMIFSGGINGIYRIFYFEPDDLVNPVNPVQSMASLILSILQIL
jgi:hypothetical protein